MAAGPDQAWPAPASAALGAEEEVEPAAQRIGVDQRRPELELGRHYGQTGRTRSRHRRHPIHPGRRSAGRRRAGDESRPTWRRSAIRRPSGARPRRRRADPTRRRATPDRRFRPRRTPPGDGSRPCPPAAAPDRSPPRRWRHSPTADAARQRRRPRSVRRRPRRRWQVPGPGAPDRRSPRRRSPTPCPELCGSPAKSVTEAAELWTTSGLRRGSVENFRPRGTSVLIINRLRGVPRTYSLIYCVEALSIRRSWGVQMTTEIGRLGRVEYASRRTLRRSRCAPSPMILDGFEVPTRRSPIRSGPLRSRLAWANTSEARMVAPISVSGAASALAGAVSGSTGSRCSTRLRPPLTTTSLGFVGVARSADGATPTRSSDVVVTPRI